MKITRYAACLSLALVALLLGACDNSYGVLSTVQEEDKTTATSTFYKATVTDLVHIGSSYLAKASSLYSRPDTSTAGSDWAYVAASKFGTTSYSCSGLAATSTTAYAAIREYVSGDMIGLYSSADGSSWSMVSGTATYDIQALYAVNNQLFVIVRDSGASTYTLYHLNGTTFEGTGIASVSPPSSSSVPITNGVYFNGGYYFGAGTTLYNGTPTTLASYKTGLGTITALATDDDLYDTDQGLFVGNAAGSVYRYDLGTTTWTAGVSVSTDTDYGITTMIVVPYGASSTKKVLLVGDEYIEGYYEADVTSGLGSFKLGDSSEIIASTSDFDSSLQYLTPFSFVYAGNTTDGILFACVSATTSDSYAGLWSIKLGSNAWDTTNGWTSE